MGKADTSELPLSPPSSSGGKPPFANYLYSLWSRGKKTKAGDSPPWMKLYPRFKLKELRKATDNFDPRRKIREDAFFTVYQASLGLSDSYTYPVSIMRFKEDYSSYHIKFFIEMGLLSKLNHPNIVSLFGYCIDGSDRIIVHPPMPNGTLHDHLHDKKYKSTPPLSWKRRLQICIGVACGLECLHTSNPLIIHRDIKSINILLDQNWVAKISGFQISRLLESGDDHVSTVVAGTLGYVDPEYLRTGWLTVKSDVYSFGVVLFEVLCGRKPVDYSDPYEERMDLIVWGRRCIEDGRVDELIDARLRGEIEPECLKAYADLAYRCSNEGADERPATGEVVKRLQLALLLQECIEANVPFSPSWLRSIVPPPKRSEPWVEIEASEISDDYDLEDLPR